MPPGPGPPWRKSKSRSPFRGSHQAYFWNSNSAQLPPPPMLWFQLLSTVRVCVGDPLHFNMDSIWLPIVRCQFLISLLCCSHKGPALNINTTGAALTHHHHPWGFRSCSAAGKKRKKRNVRKNIFPLFLWWLILWVRWVGHSAPLFTQTRI